MPGLAVLGTIADTSARAHVLRMGGEDLDVTNQNGSSYMVPIESISIEEEGPGGISGMSFSIRDPLKLVTPVAMAEVEFWDQTADLPIFRGFVQSWSMSGIVERWIDIQCIGVEVVLDWMVIPTLTIPAGTSTNTAIQACYAAATGVGVSLRTGTSTSDNGTRTNPIGELGPFATTSEDVVIAGDSLREAIRRVIDVSPVASIGPGGPFGQYYGVFTVDFWLGLRVWLGPANQIPNDYATLTVVDTVGSGTAATVLDFENDAGGIVRGVYVKGGNAAGTGLVSDGSGKPGPIAMLDDATILTSAARDSAAKAYLTDKSLATRGSITLERFSTSANVRAGSRLTITNTQAGLSAADYPIARIVKRFFVVLKPT
jgi:hypothetical protein